MIMITGGHGFIGSHVTRALLDLGESCVLVQRRPVMAEGVHDPVAVQRADVGDAAALAEIGSRYDITGIVHLAGSGFGGDPIADLRGSVNGLLNVLELARDRGVRRIGIAGTIGVYDGGGESPLTEATPLPL